MGLLNRFKNLGATLNAAAVLGLGVGVTTAQEAQPPRITVENPGTQVIKFSAGGEPPQLLTKTDVSAMALKSGLNQADNLSYPALLDKAPDTIQRSQPMFEGQTNHPLTEDEIQFLQANIKVNGTPADREKIVSIIADLNTLNSGPEILRDMCEGTTYRFEEPNSENATYEGCARFAQNDIVIKTSANNKTDTFAHETLHITQSATARSHSLIDIYKNNQMQEAAANSLSAQLTYEEYEQVVQKKRPLEKTLYVNEKGFNYYQAQKNKLDKTIKLSDVPLTQEAKELPKNQQEKIRQQYVEQLTATTVRGAFITDFMENNKNSAVVDPSVLSFYNDYNPKKAMILKQTFLFFRNLDNSEKASHTPYKTVDSEDPYVKNELAKYVQKPVHVFIPEPIKELTAIEKNPQMDSKIFETYLGHASAYSGDNLATFMELRSYDMYQKLPIPPLVDDKGNPISITVENPGTPPKPAIHKPMPEPIGYTVENDDTGLIHQLRQHNAAPQLPPKTPAQNTAENSVSLPINRGNIR